jgi:hypothetical protein
VDKYTRVQGVEGSRVQVFLDMIVRFSYIDFHLNPGILDPLKPGFPQPLTPWPLNIMSPVVIMTLKKQTSQLQPFNRSCTQDKKEECIQDDNDEGVERDSFSCYKTAKRDRGMSQGIDHDQ